MYSSLEESISNTQSDTQNRILIIEDESNIRNVLKQIFELEGWDTFVASNGKEALEILSNIPNPNFILLDLMMPAMNGWEFVQALEKDLRFKSIPVILVTAYAERAKPIKNAVAIIKKPYDIEELMAVIQNYYNANPHS